MSYEEQLSAAKFRADRDMARQELDRVREEMEEMRRRLMPEGCEWPRYDTGEKVELGCQILTSKGGGEVCGIEFNECGICVLSTEGVNGEEQVILDIENGERVKRPSVPAGDGVHIKAGDTIYSDDYKEGLIVDGYQHDGSLIAHMRDGNHVFVLNPQHFTHTKPEIDSWEKWREEFIKPPCVYCRDILGVEFDDDTELDKAFDAQIQDMERRARALAERGR